MRERQKQNIVATRAEMVPELEEENTANEEVEAGNMVFYLCAHFKK